MDKVQENHNYLLRKICNNYGGLPVKVLDNIKLEYLKTIPETDNIYENNFNWQLEVIPEASVDESLQICLQANEVNFTNVFYLAYFGWTNVEDFTERSNFSYAFKADGGVFLIKDTATSLKDFIFSLPRTGPWPIMLLQIEGNCDYETSDNTECIFQEKWFERISLAAFVIFDGDGWLIAKPLGPLVCLG